MQPPTAIRSLIDLTGEHYGRTLIGSINVQRRLSASNYTGIDGIKNSTMDCASDADTPEYNSESQDEWDGFGDYNHVDDSGMESTEVTSDEEDPIVSGIRSRLQAKPLAELSTSEIRHRLLETETIGDLTLLYPPSLWKEDQGNSLKSRQALQEILEDIQLSCEGWKEVVLTNFCVYQDIDNRRYPGQYESLHTVASEQDKRSYRLDGIVISKEKNVILNRMQIVTVSIGGLELDCHSCDRMIWVQTEETVSAQGWFRLKQPAQAYQPIWVEFLWIANFAKYCIDYLVLLERENRYGTLEDFKSDFMERISQQHGMSSDFKRWAATQTKLDMRRQMAQFGSFVYDQSYNIKTPPNSEQHPLWRQVGCFASSRSTSEEQTIVTRNTATTFLPSFPVWGPSNYDLLLPTDCDASVEAQRVQRMLDLDLPNKFSICQDRHFRIENGTHSISRVQWTLDEAVRRNRTVKYNSTQDFLYKLVVVRQHGKDCEYFDFALVTGISGNERNARVVWLTIPSSTTCASPRAGPAWTLDEREKRKAHYPIGNELFFSDDCNCFAVRLDDIVAVHNIAILKTQETNCDFFAVTRYLESEQCYVKVTMADLQVTCNPICSKRSVRKGIGGVPSDAAYRRPRSSSSFRKHEPPMEGPYDDSFTNISLFSGCGLLDRALECSGQLRTIMSIDYDPFAMCSAEANGATISEDSVKQEFIVGSVNAELHKIMSGERQYVSATCLSAGCPCPGFSLANMWKSTKKSQRDCTLLASTMSWIEVMLPAYVVIENVPNMDSGSPSACSQAISFLVSLGYQVRKLHLRASDFGGCTIRKRLFIIAAAPSYSLPDEPEPTHGGSELLSAVSIHDAVSDLPPIHNDTLTNIREPYHIPFERLTANLASGGVNFRDMLHRIPQSPTGQSLVTSLESMTEKQRQWAQSLKTKILAKRSAAMGRVDPNKPFATIVTAANWRCGFTGRVCHYDQDRILSLEEIARAQGVPENFVLIGSTAQKQRQIGNAVPWCLREAIGKELAKAYSRSKPRTVESVKTKNERQTIQSLVSGARYKLQRQADNDEDDDDKDDDLIISNEADFKLAVSKRVSAGSVSNATEPQSTSRQTSRTSKHFQSVIITSIKQQQAVQIPSRQVTLRGTNESSDDTSRSTRSSKRLRSVSELNDDDRTAKKRARQLSMEVEMSLVGASTEGDSDSSSDNDEDESSGSSETGDSNDDSDDSDDSGISD